jgi:hypothetical protein
MDPTKHKIVDFTGIIWEVISKLKEDPPRFVLKAPNCPVEIYSFAPEHGRGEKVSIVDEEFEPSINLNHPDTYIVNK